MSQARAVERATIPAARRWVAIGSSGGDAEPRMECWGFLPADHIDVCLAAVSDQVVGDRTEQEPPPTALLRLPTTILLMFRRRACARISSLTREPLSVTVSAAELLGQAEGLGQPGAFGLRQVRMSRCLDARHDPFRP